VHRIGGLAHGLPQPVRVRLPRHLQDRAIGVEQAAVVAAADAFLCNQAELQRRATVTAVEVQDPDIAAAVAEHHQVFAQDLGAHWNVVELIEESDGMPKAAQILAAWSAAANRSEIKAGSFVARGCIAGKARA
jgi:hypothetical protein